MPLTIVIADDHPDYRTLVRLLVGALSDVLVVGEAADGPEALALVLRECPDLVIADMVMPRLNGVELTTRIKQERPQTKVILMSAYTQETYRRAAAVSGADAFVYKQAISGDLPALIAKVGGRPLAGDRGLVPPSADG
jgi:two-component system response regulator DesR